MLANIPWYYLVISLVTCLAMVWFVRRGEQQNLNRQHLLNIFLIVIVSAFVGARIFHALFEYPTLYLNHPQLLFQIWQGGYVFFGGAVSGFIAAYWYCHSRHLSFLKYLDVAAPVAGLAYAFGRVGCFLAGCCYGRFCELPWAWQGRHPTQLYALIIELWIVWLLLLLEKRKAHPTGSIFFAWMTLHGLGRLFMEYFRDDFRGPVFVMSISSWFSLALIVLGGFLSLRPYFKKI